MPKLKESDSKLSSKESKEKKKPKASSNKDTTVKEKAKAQLFNPWQRIDQELDAAEKRFSLSAMAVDKREPRFSTGLLSLDAVLSGGLIGGGWYTAAGGEQSAKSTLVMSILGSVMSEFLKNPDLPIKASIFDYEGSTGSAGDYFENILKSMGVNTKIENVFGVQDEETGQWIIKPTIRYYQPDTGERFFDYVAKLQKILPDKIRIGSNWYYVYENTRENQKLVKGHYDKSYFSKHNKFKIPAPDGNVQAIIMVDSYPCMNPERSDEKEEGDQSIASQARMFSDGIKRIKGKLRRKRIIIMGINQLRAVPMAMYGPKEIEPGGQALAFNSDVRFRTASCALSAVNASGKSGIEEEESVCTSGYDKYRYIRLTTIKNKMGGIPNQTIFLRIVHENADGEATGFCRTWDAYQYMKLTGQIAGKIESDRKKIKFVQSFTYTDAEDNEKTITFNHPFVGKTITWLDFKALIDGNKKTIIKMCKALKLSKPVMLRSVLEKQVRSGQGYTYLKANKRMMAQAAKSKVKADVDSDDDDD